MTIRGSNGGSGNRILTAVLVLIIVVIVGLILFQFASNRNQQQTSTETADNEVTETPTVTEEPEEDTPTPTPTVTTTTASSGSINVTTTVPENWKAIEIASLPYQFYRPNNFYYRLNGNTLGIDPNPIPEASEHAGIITFTKVSNSKESIVNEQKSALTGATQFEQTAGDNQWTILTGTIPESEIRAEQKAKIGVITGAGSTYILMYATSPASFSTYEAIFDILLGIIAFE